MFPKKGYRPNWILFLRGEHQLCLFPYMNR
jgi:hypothetical protein